MKLMRLIFSLLILASCARAQIGVQMPILYQLLSSSQIPRSIPYATFWWVSSDLTNNVNVTNWVDRISGVVRTNGAPSLQPTNSSGGVGYASGVYLTNTPVFTANSNGMTVWTIITPQASGLFGAIEGCDNSGGAGWIYTHTGNNFDIFGINSSSTFGGYSPAATLDICLISTNKTGNVLAYTNGVFISVLGCGQVVGNMLYSGRDAGGNFYNGKVIEVEYIYTNITPTMISNLHYYATNTYHYSP